MSQEIVLLCALGLIVGWAFSAIIVYLLCRLSAKLTREEEIRDRLDQYYKRNFDKSE